MGGGCSPRSCYNSVKYKWVILVSGCISTFLRGAFIIGTLPVLSIYFEQRYNDRKLSSTISAIQTASSFIATLPAMILCKNIGASKLQIIGAALSGIGMTITAFSTQAWQGLIGNGIISGAGSAFVYAGCYNAISQFFPGGQLVPYVALDVTFSLGVLATPILYKYMIEALGFRDCLLVTAGLMLINVITGIIHREPRKEHIGKLKKYSSNKKKHSLKIKGGRQGVFHAKSNTTAHLIATTIKLATATAAVDCANQEHSADDRSQTDDGPNQTRQDDEKLNSSDDISIERKSISIKIKENKMAINFLIAAFCGYAGFTAHMGNLGDYATFGLRIPEDEFTEAMTYSGIARLVTGTVYILIARYFVFSSVCMYSCSLVLQAVMIFAIVIAQPGIIFITPPIWQRTNHIKRALLSYLMLPDSAWFKVMNVLSGIFAQLFRNSMFGSCIEVTTPKRAAFMHMIQTMADGFGSTMASFLTAYLQVEVDINAGFYFAGGMMLLSALILLPTAITTLRTPKVYESDLAGDDDVLHQAYFVPDAI